MAEAPSEPTMTSPLLPEAAEDPLTGDQLQRVAEIISRGQRKRPGGMVTSLLLFATAILSWMAFPPLDIGPLGWVCLVPALQLVRLQTPSRWMYRLTWLIGFLFWIVTLQWMRLGDPTMYIALFAMAMYLACYWVAFLWLTRSAVLRLHIPLLIAVPILWTGLEYLRAHLMTGFSWYYLGHTQYRWINVIQISDLVGAYGVSFLVALANAGLAHLVPARWLQRWQLMPVEEQGSLLTFRRLQQLTAVAVAAALVIVSCLYGAIRRGGESFPRGPRIALVQGNFIASARKQHNDPLEIFMTHRSLSGMTVAESPDVIVWPEGMFPWAMYLKEGGVTDQKLKEVAPEVPAEFWREAKEQQALVDLADMTNSALIIGLSTFTASPLKAAWYNSAVMVQPGIGVVNRYDKIHRVPFGEYIPLIEWLPFLQSFTPYRGQFGLTAGTQAHVFRYKNWELIPLICFEDTVPHLVRRIAQSVNINGPDQTQCLVNLTNDGWFHGSSELEQHLICSLFRAVETRTPIVRAVNTGISAIIDGDGVIREPDEFMDGGTPGDEAPRYKSVRNPRTGRFYKQMNCALVSDVPLDPRRSLYVTIGDSFAVCCLAACLAVALSGAVQGSRKRQPGLPST